MPREKQREYVKAEVCRAVVPVIVAQALTAAAMSVGVDDRSPSLDQGLSY